MNPNLQLLSSVSLFFIMTKFTKNVSSLAIKIGITRSNKMLKRALSTGTKKKKNNVNTIDVKTSLEVSCNINHLDIDLEEDDDTKYVFGDEIFEEPIYFEEDIEDRQFESLNQLGPTNRIDINSEWVSAIDREVPSFDMKKLSKYLAISSNKSSYLQQDDNQKLIQGGNVTIGSFARSIHEWSKDNNVQSVGIDALMTILSKTFNGYKLPVKVVATTEEEYR